MQRLRAVAAGLAGLVALAGCAGSGFEYVTHREMGLFFKIPEHWESFRVDEGADEAGGRWVTVVDAAPDAAVDHFEDRLPRHPVGVAEVVEVGGQRDEISLAFLRSLALGGAADPIELARQGNPQLQVLRYDDIATGDGYRGARVALTLQLDGGDQITIDHIALVDNATTTLYRLMIKCEASCYAEHADEIDGIVESWTIEERP